MNLNTLTEKYIYWNTDNRISKNFYKNLPTGTDLNSKYAIENTNENFYLIQKDSATFFCLKTGIIHRIDHRWGPLDVKCNKELYQRSLDTGTFLVDKHLDDSTFNLMDKKFLYTVVQRPLNDIGKEVVLDIGDGSIDIQFLEQFIDSTREILLHLKKVAENNNAGYTANGIYPTHRVKLKNGQYAWKTFHKWTDTYETMIAKSLEVLLVFSNISVCFQELSAPQNKNVMADILTNARQKWTI